VSGLTTLYKNKFVYVANLINYTEAFEGKKVHVLCTELLLNSILNLKRLYISFFLSFFLSFGSSFLKLINLCFHQWGSKPWMITF